jgi:dTDP-glucose 4,6-dehydratase
MNIGNPYELSVLDLAKMVRDIAGSKSEITFVPRPTDDPTVRQPDISLARDVLGWEPKVHVRDGLQRTIEWFREHPDLVRPLAS